MSLGHIDISLYWWIKNPLYKKGENLTDAYIITRSP
jgi:hypothetical protein